MEYSFLVGGYLILLSSHPFQILPSYVGRVMASKFAPNIWGYWKKFELTHEPVFRGFSLALIGFFTLRRQLTCQC